MSTKKPVRKKYLIQKRFAVWLSMDVEASSFDDAVASAMAMEFDDFAEVKADCDLSDVETLDGTSVGESF